MGFFKSLFGGEPADPEEEKRREAARQFDLFKYDGVRALRMGQADYAVKCFEKALEIRDDLETRDYLSQALMHKGDLSGAREQLDALHKAQPDNAAILIRKADVDYMLEDYEAMAADSKAAIALSPDDPRALFDAARADIGLKDDTAAVATLDRCADLCEEKMKEKGHDTLYNIIGDVRLLRGQTLLRNGDIDGAAADAGWLRQHTHDSEDVLLFAAQVEEATGQHQSAADFYSQVIALNPFSAEAFRGRAAARRALGDAGGAAEDEKSLSELSHGGDKDSGVEGMMQRTSNAIDPFGFGDIKGPGE